MSHTCKSVISHTWTSRISLVTHVNESCHNYEWVTSRMSMRHVTLLQESCRHTCEWVVSQGRAATELRWFPLLWRVMSLIWMSHVTQVDEPRCTYEWVMSHIWMSHITHMTESYHAYEWVMSHIWLSHVTHMTESCHTYEQVMLHIWMSHVTQSSSWKTRSRRTARTAHSSLEDWMSHATHVNELCHTCEWVMSHIWLSHVTHMNESYYAVKKCKDCTLKSWKLNGQSCYTYGVAMISRLLKIIGLFCKRAL